MREGVLTAGARMRQDPRLRVLGIDPGGTTGVCMVSGSQLQWGRELRSLQEVAEVVRQEHPDLIVMEDYLGSVAARDYKDPCMVIGAVQLVASDLGIPVVLQAPNSQERFRVKILESKLHSSPHVRSALAHVMYWLAGKS